MCVAEGPREMDDRAWNDSHKHALNHGTGMLPLVIRFNHATGMCCLVFRFDNATGIISLDFRHNNATLPFTVNAASLQANVTS